jgi:hypothetical protein
MNNILLFALILIPAGLFIYFMFRANQRQMQRLIDPKAMEETAMRLQKMISVEAMIQHKAENIRPEAKGLAKVDLELKLQPDGVEPILAKTCWLVEVERLPELEAGKSVQVKYNPKKPDRIYPTVPWAQVWVFEN